MADVVGDGFTELLVRIVAGSDPVRGQIEPRDGPGAEFSGWSEFAAMIERFRGQPTDDLGAAHGADPW